MRKLNCRSGDLAITVDAYNPVNIGSIVRVLHKHHNQSALSVEPDDLLWYVEAAHYLTYSKGEKVFRRKRGAAPDSYLRPIRGNPLSNDVAVQVIDSIDRQEGKLRDFEVTSDKPAVARKLPADGRFVSIQQLGNLSLIVSSFHKGVDLISFNLAEMFVGHGQLRLAGQEALNA